MTRPTLDKVGDNIIAYNAGGKPADPYPIAAEYEVFSGWRDEYQDLCYKKSPSDDYLNLGRKMFGWLEAKGLWAQIGQDVLINGCLEIRIPFSESQESLAGSRLFLDLPWEILANDQGFLADKPGNPFYPIRRIGTPSQTPEPAPYRLGLTFMAAAPGGVKPELPYELEEVAILKATDEANLDLSVEESGNVELLAEHIADRKKGVPGGHEGIEVLHISCHGRAPKDADPVLLLEDEYGDLNETTAQLFLAGLGPQKSKLLFLSACQTAKDQSGFVASDSFAVACVEAGMPAVLGWGESVNDRQATFFSAELYKQLSRGLELEASVAHARYCLLHNGENDKDSNDWHLARLYLGPNGGGILANGWESRLGIGREHGIKEFLDKEGQQVPVASQFEFVGRRQYIRDILKVYKDHKFAGVLLHGTGRQGKSSLAARIASWLRHHSTVVIYGPKELGGDQSVHYTAPMILEKIAKKDFAGVTKIIDGYREQVQADHYSLRGALKEILDQCEKNGCPLLLVVDDFEQALEDPKPGCESIQSVKECCAEAITALIEAFDAHRDGGRSRLLFTSRNKFNLPSGSQNLAVKLKSFCLEPMTPVESSKQALARGIELDTELRKRIVKAAKGNAGLQDRLFRLGKKDSAVCSAALDGLEAYLSSGKDPDQEEVRAHLDDIFAKTLFAVLRENERNILRASTFFHESIPEHIFAELFVALCLVKDPEAARQCFERLVAFGLWDSMPDYFDREAPCYAVAPLAAPRAIGHTPLNEAEKRQVAGVALPLLFKHWIRPDEGRRPLTFDLELFRLACLTESAEVLNVCGAAFFRAMQDQVHYEKLAEEALEVVNTIRNAKIVPEPELLYIAAEVCQRGGKVHEAVEMAEEAVEAIKQMDTNEEDNQFQLASARLRLADMYSDTAKLDEALEQLQMAKAEFADINRLRDQNITTGHIARIYVDKGRVDEALTLHQEEMKIYEELGDRRSRAVTLGDIARIYASKGRVDEALTLHQEEMKIYEELGDRRSRAVTLGDIARIYASKGRVDEALTLHQEMKDIFEELGDRRSRAVTLGDIARIYASKGRVDEALTLHQERKDIFEELGDQDGMANSDFALSQIFFSQEKLKEAIPLAAQSFDRLLALGRVDAIGVVGQFLGHMLLLQGEKGKAKDVLKKSREAFVLLGRQQDVEQVDAMLQAAISKEDIAEALEKAREAEDDEAVEKLSAMPELEELKEKYKASPDDPATSPGDQALLEAMIPHLRTLGQDEQADGIAAQLAQWRRAS